MSSNFRMKFSTQIQFRVATKKILSSKLQCEPDYFGHYIYMCFIGYQKAFDRVKHNKLIEVLGKANIPDLEQ